MNRKSDFSYNNGICFHFKQNFKIKSVILQNLFPPISYNST